MDAIPPEDLRDLAESVIRQHVDPRQLNIVLAAEENERKALTIYADKMSV